MREEAERKKREVRSHLPLTLPVGTSHPTTPFLPL